MSTAILAYSIASEVLDRLGLEYSREQESKADESAKELMKLIKQDDSLQNIRADHCGGDHGLHVAAAGAHDVASVRRVAGEG